MWFATEDATGQPVTLRLIPSPTPAVRDRLRAGVSLMSAIDHLHVVPLLEAVDVPQGVVVKCGAAEGGSLADALSMRGTLPPGEVVTACAPIADALAEIHPHGIMHGAITADDIVFTLDGRPMLAGVGLAQLGVLPQREVQPIAPEISAGSPPSPSSDVYSLAAVAFMGMTGVVPQPPVNLQGVPPQVLAILSRALERAPERRPDATMLSNALYAVAPPEPVEIIASTDATGAMPAVAPTPDASPQPASDFTAEGDKADEEVANFMRGGGGSGSRRRSRRVGSRRQKGTAPAAGETPPPVAGAVPPTGTVPPASMAPAASGPSQQDVQLTKPVDASGASRRSVRRKPEPTAAAAPAKPEPKRQESERSNGRERPQESKPSKFDVTKVAIVAIVLLVGFGVYLVMQQFLDGDSGELSLDRSSPTDGATPDDLCGGPRPAPTAAPPEVTDWTAEVQRLYSLRERAYEELDATVLCQVYSPVSSVLAEDVDWIRTLIEEDSHAEGFRVDIIEVEVVEQTAGRVVLNITDQVSAHEIVNSDGETVGEEEQGPVVTWQAELVAVADDAGATPSWRFGG